jgi:oxygen-independent coproporphyrinogen-3 oxidase
MYALIVEEGTPFFARRARGKLPVAGEDTEAAMFARAIERARDAGYERYEVSNYAREPRFRSRHNRIYWRNEPYFGFGAGAASYLGGARTMNERLPARYADRIVRDGTATVAEERLTPRETMGETMMLGLRLAEGVALDAFAERFGTRAENVWTDEIARLRDAGLIEITHGRLRLTERGLFVGSEVMLAFLA